MLTKMIKKDAHWIYWLAIHDRPISESDARDAQIAAGYWPAGYGFDAFESSDKADSAGKYHVAEWRCSASCD